MVGISFAPLFVRFALPAPPVTTGFYRMVFAALVVGAWVLPRGGLDSLPRRSRLAALAAGLCFGTDIALWHTSIVYTSVATATLLVNTTPIHVGIWSALVLRQKLPGRFVAGAGLALLGASLLLGLSWGDALHWRGALLSLFAAVFYSGYLLLMSVVRRTGDAVPALFLASLGATAALAAYTQVRGDPLVGFPAHAWAAFAGAALVSQVFGVMGIVWSLRHLPPTVASVAVLSQPVGTALLGWLLLGESIAPLQAVGGGAVLAGIALASGLAGPRAR